MCDPLQCSHANPCHMCHLSTGITRCYVPRSCVVLTYVTWGVTRDHNDVASHPQNRNIIVENNTTQDEVARGSRVAPSLLNQLNSQSPVRADNNQPTVTTVTTNNNRATNKQQTPVNTSCVCADTRMTTCVYVLSGCLTRFETSGRSTCRSRTRALLPLPPPPRHLLHPH